MDAPDKVLHTARRSHRKTRTGCRTCKRRKIKCDEGRPSCWNCIKHSVSCDFLPPAASPAGSSNVGTPPGHHVAGFIGRNGIWSSPTNTFSSSFAMANNGALPELNMNDLELLHHWSLSTSLSMTSDPVLRTLWRTKIPQMAFEFPFLMRGILTVAALHLAYLHPERRDFYVSNSLQHHDIALSGATEVLPNVSNENCMPLHIFSILTCIHSLGRPRKPEDFLVVGEQGIAKWFVLFKGVVLIIERFSETMSTGPLAAFFHSRVRRQRQRQSCIETSTMDHLSSLRASILSAPLPPDTAQMYLDNMIELQNSFSFVYSCPSHSHELGDIFIWLFRCSDGYLVALQEGTQEALAIFAYACVLFWKMEKFWWMEGWSGLIMNNIWNWLDDAHKSWIEWPISEIGWSPPEERGMDPVKLEQQHIMG
ncbi:hypothetical protein HYFRA_00000464 [Hymenoscyphus fraxineus]|uniref:Zn(2)-C6 fungal-type domain-containing protein n=1 Tax=Hymenoscyphus fraxineus TaxID=746836 RepID=A0A9N9PWS7_9HELO|nr:hypothetical protein HYFRA_00000464 [Hymenoscyphus fraxineus]